MITAFVVALTSSDVLREVYVNADRYSDLGMLFYNFW